MDLAKLKQYMTSTLEILDLSESRYASIRIIRQENGQFSASLLLNSDDTFGRRKSRTNKQRDVQRKKAFLAKKSATNPCRQSPAPDPQEPRKVGTENADNTSQSLKNSVAGAGADHLELPDAHQEETLPSIQTERRIIYPKTFSEITSTSIPAPAVKTVDVTDEIFITPTKKKIQNVMCSSPGDWCDWVNCNEEGPEEDAGPFCRHHEIANDYFTKHTHIETCKFHEKRSNLPIACEERCDRYDRLWSFYPLCFHEGDARIRNKYYWLRKERNES